jgi:hypothetical protein
MAILDISPELLVTSMEPNGPNITITGRKNIVCAVDYMQQLDPTVLQKHRVLHSVLYADALPTSTLIDGALPDLPIGSCVEVFVVSGQTVTGASKWYKVADAAAATDFVNVTA